MRAIASLGLVVGLLVACTPGERFGAGAPPPAGCVFGYGQCVTGGTAAACAASYGTWSEAGCPSSALLGTCVDEVITYYYAPWWTAAFAEASCSGSWFAETSAAPPDPGGSEVVSCTIGSYGCIELVGASAAEQAELAADCVPEPYLVWSETSCSLGGAVAGHCELGAGSVGGSVVRMFYSAASYTLGEAQADCAEQLGAWVY